MTFINREPELKYLNGLWRDHTAHLVVVYGKRRTGKTALIREFIRDKKAVYFLAGRITATENLKLISRKIGDHFNDDFIRERGFSAWRQVLEYLEKQDDKMVFVIDEFPYLVESEPGMAGMLQQVWDETLKDSKILVILSGSSIGVMETETLDYKSPLYGRRSGQILVKTLSFTQSKKFYPALNLEEFIEFYTVTGGIPAYLLKFDGRASLRENIERQVLQPSAYLYNEVDFILREELREPRTYLSILKAIAYGRRKFGEIVNETGLAKNIIMKYLNVLEDLYLITKEVPVTEKKPPVSKKGLYRISEQYFTFWFNYVYPYRSELEMGRTGIVFNRMKQTFYKLVSGNYETVAAEILRDHSGDIFPFQSLGRWWDKNEEIDLVAINDEKDIILFGEAKWSNKPVGTNIFDDLRRKASLVTWGTKNRKERYALFSKSGFTPEMKKRAKAENIYLFEKDRMTHTGSVYK